MRLHPHVCLATAVLCFVALSGCGGGSTGSGSGGGGGGTVTPFVYTTDVDQSGAGSILAVPEPGTAGASQTLAAPTGTTFQSIRSDGAGHIYVLNVSPLSGINNPFTVDEYTASNGKLTLVRSFNSTAPYGPEALVASPDGTVYVSCGDNTVKTFAASASGAVTPTNSFLGNGWARSLAIDSSGDIFQLITNDAAIYEYAAGFPSETPIRTINIRSYENAAEADMVVDASDHLYVLGSSSQTNGGPMTGVILEYDPGATLPTQTITGSATGLVQPLAIAVDTHDHLFVEEYDPSGGNVRTGSVFSSSANGNVAPTSTFSITQYDTIVHDVPGLAVQ